jgi:hypothetical protein
MPTHSLRLDFILIDLVLNIHFLNAFNHNKSGDVSVGCFGLLWCWSTLAVAGPWVDSISNLPFIYLFVCFF